MDIDHLVQARATLIEDGEGWCQMGNFVSLCCEMRPPNVSAPDSQDCLTLAIRSVTQHEWNMLTVIERLEWMRASAVTQNRPLMVT